MKNEDDIEFVTVIEGNQRFIQKMEQFVSKIKIALC